MAIAFDYVQVTGSDSVAKKVSNSKITNGGTDYFRQITSIGDAETFVAVAKVANAAPSAADYGLVTRAIPNPGQNGATQLITAGDPFTGSGSGYSTGTYPIIGTPTTGSYKGLLLSNGETYCSISVDPNPATNGTIFFEQSHDTTNLADGHWILLPLRRAGQTGTTALYTDTTNPSIGDAGTWEGACPGATGIRVRYFDGTTAGSGIPVRLNARIHASRPEVVENVNIVGGSVGVNGTVAVSVADKIAVSNRMQSQRCSFEAPVTNGIDTRYMTLLRTGTGMTVNQVNGNLVVTSGTTANSETVIRGLNSLYDTDFILRFAMLLSQRIANCSVFVEMLDLPGQNDASPYTINSATSVSVTVGDGLQFSNLQVGMSVTLCALTSVGIPGRATVASFPSYGVVNLTVSGWPASGSGTLSLMGLNFHQVQYSGVTATSLNYDTQRLGYNSGYTAATINTALTPGHVVTMTGSEGEGALFDQTGASVAGLETLRRASRIRNVSTTGSGNGLYWQIRVLNGSTAPASSTTVTIGFVDLIYGLTNGGPALPVSIVNVGPMSANSGLPVEIVNNPILGAGSAAIGTIGVTSLPALAAGANIIGDIGQSMRSTANAATLLRITSAASNNALNVKNSAGRIARITLYNTATSIRWLKLYNLATLPVPASSPVFFSVPIPAGTATVPGFIDLDPDALGVYFSTGIGIAIVATNSDTDTAALGAAGEITGLLQYA